MIKKIVVIAFLFILTVSCNKNKSETKISSTSESSHNMGQNCMSCHVKGGKGEGWFQVAGTVYGTSGNATNPNSTIHLYSAPNGGGTLKYTLLVDKSGNFYTTETIDFGSGLYPSVAGKTATAHMSSSTSSGQCNSCHGVSTSKIWAN